MKWPIARRAAILELDGVRTSRRLTDEHCHQRARLPALQLWTWRRWRRAAGFTRTEVVPLAGPTSAAVAYK